MDTNYLSYRMLDQIMGMSEDVRKKYDEALTLITSKGTQPEKAFEESGFREAFEKEGGVMSSTSRADTG
jgi:hypothetical protein